MGFGWQNEGAACGEGCLWRSLEKSKIWKSQPLRVFK
jgi:hypothetical protein